MAIIKTQYEIISIDHVEVMADVSLLPKSDELFFNATLMAKYFDKKPDDFLRLQSTKEYIVEILKESQFGNSRSEDLVRVTNGGKYKGTWMHQELAFEFAGWLSPVFRRGLHKWAENRFNEERLRKEERLRLRTGYLPMTLAIQNAHADDKFYHYSNESNLINKLVTGLSAKKFKKQHGVDDVRSALTAEQSLLMDKLQQQNTSLIELGFGFDERKEMLSKQVNQIRLLEAA